MNNFYPRPPRGGRLPPQFPLLLPFCDFYPRPPRGGRLEQQTAMAYNSAISIHALREEGDRPGASRRFPCGPISIHALREEGDLEKYAGSNPR